MHQFPDDYAALIDDIRRELTNDVPPEFMVKFEVAVARVITSRLAAKRKKKRSVKEEANVRKTDPQG